jgi:hypothetical protein
MALQSLVLDEDLLLDEYNHRLFNTIHIIAVEISNCARAVEATEMRPTLLDLGSGLIDHSQKMTVAAMQMADMKVWAHRS